jgi:hypothetical protein
MQYIMSAAYDLASNSVYTLTVPNNITKRFVVSRFDRKDLMLSEEFVPALAKDAGFSLGKDRSLGEYMVTGATVAEGQLYAVSASYGTLLTLDLATHRIIAAHVVPGLVRPTGIAAKGAELVIISDDGTVTIVARPMIGPGLAPAIPADSSRSTAPPASPSRPGAPR